MISPYRFFGISNRFVEQTLREIRTKELEEPKGISSS